MPAHNGKLTTCYGIFDPQTMEYTHKNLQYEYEHTAQQMKKNNYPQCYAKTISKTGFWPNEDILPVGERKFCKYCHEG